MISYTIPVNISMGGHKFIASLRGHFNSLSTRNLEEELEVRISIYIDIGLVWLLANGYMVMVFVEAFVVTFNVDTAVKDKAITNKFLT